MREKNQRYRELETRDEKYNQRQRATARGKKSGIEEGEIDVVETIRRRAFLL